MALRIQQASDEAGFKNVGQLAIAAGASRQQGYAWTNMANPQPPTKHIKEIARLTRKSEEWLMDGTEPPPAEQIDYARLAIIFKVITEETSDMGIELNHDQMARIVSAAYRASPTVNRIDRPLIHQMVALLAG